MKRDVIIDYENLQNVYEILLDNQPNIEFNINIDEKEYIIEIRTFINDETYITISTETETICNYASIKTGIDLAYLSTLENVVFFFERTTDETKEKPYNYLDFNNNIRFYYGFI